MNKPSDLPLIAPKKFVLWFTLGHAIVSVAAFAWSFSLGMANFDDGAPEGPGEAVLHAFSQTLLFPIFTGFTRLPAAQFLFPGVLGWLPLVANSVFWAFLVWLLFASARRISSTTAAQQ